MMRVIAGIMVLLSAVCGTARAEDPAFAGYEESVRRVERAMNAAGARVLRQTFDLATPVDRGSRIEVGGRSFAVYHLYPNLVAFGVNGPRALEGELVWLGRGTLEEMRGKTLEGKIAVMELASGRNWTQAVNLGAKGVVFVQPAAGEATYSDYREKTLQAPVEVARFLMPRERAEEFRAAARTGARGTISTEAGWERRPTHNLFAYVPGREKLTAKGAGGKPGREMVALVHVNAEAVSLVPGLTPGAETELNLRLLEELLSRWKREPPAMSVLVTAFGGNAYGLAGAKEFMGGILGQGGRKDREGIGRIEAQIGELEKLRGLVTDEAVADPLPALRTLAQTEEGGRHPLIAKLYGLVSIESSEVSDAIVAAIEEAGKDRKAAEAALKGLRQRREELNYLSVLRWRGFETAGESGARRSAVLQWFRAKGADAADDPALAATARGNLSRFMGRVRERLDAQIADARRRVEKLRRDGELAAFLADKQIVFALGLDISARSNGLALISEGDHWQSLELDGFHRQLGVRLEPFAKEFDARHRGEGGGAALVNALAKEFKDSPRKHVRYPVASAGEALALAGIPGTVVCGSGDFRQYYDTPEDTIDARWEREAGARLKVAADCAEGLVREIAELARPETAGGRRPILPLAYRPDNLKWGRVYGKAVLPASAQADETLNGVGGTLVALPGELKQGLRNGVVVKTDGSGEFVLPVVPTERAWVPEERRQVRLFAFQMDRATGLVQRAMDQGTAGAAYPQRFTLKSEEKGTSLVMFECRSVSVLNCFDPRTFRPLLTPRIFAGQGNAEQRQFGAVEALTPQEASVTCFVAGRGRIKMVFPGPDFFARMMLLNSSEKQKLGAGFATGESRVLRTPELQVAHDLWWRTEELLKTLSAAGIESGFMNYTRDRGRESLERAGGALAAKDYPVYMSEASMAWSLASRNYPEVLGLANSSVRGMVFFLFLIIPCALATERLLFSFSRVLTRFIATVVIGTLMYLVVSQLHPAFKIVSNPLLLFIAFGIMSLTFYVIILLWSRFEGYVARWKAKEVGVTRESLSRGAALGVAFSVSVGNMRRAPARTALTIASLTLFTVVVLSLVSVKASLSVNAVAGGHRPSFDGLMLRDQKHEGLPPSLAERLRTFYGAGRTILERRVSDARLAWGQGWATTAAVSGVPEELQRGIVTGGETLRGRARACLLPAISDPERGIDTRTLLGSTRRISGHEVTVAGVFDPAAFERLVGLDGEPMTPVDLEELRDLKLVNAQLGQKDAEVVAPHAPAARTAILSDDLMDLLDGVCDGILIEGGTAAERQRVARDLVLRTDFYCYVGEKGESTVFSSSGRQKVRGLAEIGIPLFICGLIIVNTMFGAVASQMRHIPTLSAVGLAPKHIASLFIVEAVVYSVLSVLCGYVCGQLIAKTITHFNLIPGMVLDYSSASGLAGCFIVIVVTLLSTAYPAYRAMTEATPKSDHEDKPSFEGDRVTATLPFTLTGAQAAGAVAFLHQFIAEHREFGADSFYVQDPALRRVRVEGRDAFEMEFKMWLAPVDLGNSQTARIRACTDESDVMHIRVEATRVTGDLHSWRMCNMEFLTELRKQLLLWRMVETEEKERYVRMMAEVR